MIKRIISLFLVVVISLCLSVYCNANVDTQYQKTNFMIGDANGDGEINVNDCLSLINVLINSKNSYILYERADLNADYICDVTDLLFLRKYIARLSVELIDSDFARNVGDITDQLEDLGKNNFDTSYVDWDDSSVEKTVARNPNDMIAYKSKVYVTGGNYNSNQGPVRVTYYARENKEGKSAGNLETEQINRFYMYDDMIFTTSIDEKNWGAGSVYYLKDYRFSFQTKYAVLPKNIHCYDMTKFNDTYFFAGSAVDYNNTYVGYSGNTLELSKGIIYMFKGDDITKCTSADFVDVPMINKNGKKISFDICVSKKTTSDGRVYYTNQGGVPRVYDLFEWNDNLYAFYYDQYAYNTYLPQENNFNGLYKYDVNTNEFVYQSNLKIDGLREKFESSQDRNKVLHDFQWDNKYYFVTDSGLMSTTDFITYKDEYISEVPNSIVRDVIFKDDSAYLICSEVNSKGSYTNRVYETTDFVNYNPILSFDAPSYARSFEYCNGAFYFGLGATIEGNYCNLECGRIYRYIYYK